MNHALDQLPLFATDLAIAEAIVGKAAAKEWVKTRLPTLATKPGFPPIDAFHSGRAVPLVKLFYANYLGLPADGRGMPDGPEDEGSWRKQRAR